MAHMYIASLYVLNNSIQGMAGVATYKRHMVGTQFDRYHPLQYHHGQKVVRGPNRLLPMPLPH